MTPNKQTVLVVDDEKYARQELMGILQRRHGDIIGEPIEAEATQAAWSRIERGGIDGVFLDIEFLTESLEAGLDLACRISNLEAPPWIVFVSGHDEFGVKAFDADPAYFVLKPVDDAKVAKALERVGKRRRSMAVAAGLPRGLDIRYCSGIDDDGRKRYKDKYLEPREQLLYVRSVKNDSGKNAGWLCFHLADGSDLQVVGKLEDWKERLAPYGFVDIHRSFLVNRAFRDTLWHEPGKDGANDGPCRMSLRGCDHVLPVRRYFQW